MKRFFLLFVVAFMAAKTSFAIVGSPQVSVAVELFSIEKAETEKPFLTVQKMKKPRLADRFFAKIAAKKAAAKSRYPGEDGDTSQADRLANLAFWFGISGLGGLLLVRVASVGAGFFSTTSSGLGLIFGVLGLQILAMLALLAAIILGAMALRRGTALRNRAKLGMILGIVYWGLLVLGFLLFALLFASLGG